MADNKPEVDRAEAEVFSDATNAWVIRTPGRAIPAVLIQGDTLSILVHEAEALLQGLRAASGIDSELMDSATELRDRLRERLDHYEAALDKHGIQLPYNR